MHQLFIGPGAALFHDAVAPHAFAHGLAVVAGQPEKRVVPQPQLADLAAQDAEVLVAQGDLFGEEAADVPQLFFGVDALGLTGERLPHVGAFIIRVVGALHVRIPY